MSTAKSAVSQSDRLGTAPVTSLLFQLAIPTVLAQLVNLLYNIVDRMYVGRIPGSGSLALAGLGVTFPITILISAFSCLVGMGGASRMSLAMGNQDTERAKKILNNSMAMLLVFSIVLSTVFSVTKRPILLAFGASENTLPYADAYLTIYLLGTIFVQIAFGMNQFITNQGFTKISMATVCIGAVINIILDPIFIFVFHMGVQGAALATILSQCVSALWVLKFLSGKKPAITLQLRYMKFEKEILLSIFSLGISPFVMQATECLIQLTFNNGMLRYGNDLYVALMSILFSLMQVIWLPMQGFSQGAQPIIGYNYGAENIVRVKKTFQLLWCINLTFSFTVILLLELFPAFFLGLFTNDAEIIQMGIPAVRVFMFSMAIMGTQSACQQTFLALGEAKISMFLALLRKVILLFPLALILPHVGGLGVWGLFLAEPISDFLAACTTTIMFYFRSKTLFATNPQK